MAKSQTFSVSLSLLTKNFSKGVKTVQTSLNNLKMQFRNFAAAMGAGLGISEIARNMIDSAKQLDKAQTVLKNVSNGLDGYGKNQKFVMDISKKYNQELTTLMNNYAKFHSAANMAGIALEEQQYIYESLTRAATYYSLTADEMNGVMLAVNQMISKGKVSSEELRRQLGERLPGAMNMAAKAMGVTTAELDKMIRDGKVMASDLLPKLAKELNKVTKDVNIDHIQGALAKMKNAFTDLTSKLNVADVYKKIINGVANGFEYLSNHLNSVKQNIISTFAAILGGNFFNKMKANFNAYVADLQSSLNSANTLLMTHKSQLAGLVNKGLIELDFDDKKFITGIRNIGNLTEEEFLKASRHVANYNKYLERSNEIGAQSKTALGWMANGFKKVGKAIKSMMSSFAPMAIIYAITAIIQKIGAWYKEQKRIRDIVKDTKKEYDDMAKKLGGDDVELQSIQKSFFSDEYKSDDKRAKLIRRTNELLGLQGKKAFTLASTNEEINAAIQKRLNLLKEEREYQAARAIVAEKQTQADLKRAELGKKQKEYDAFMQDINNPNSKYIDAYTYELTNEGAAKKIGLENDIKNLSKEIKNLDEAIAEYSDDVTKGGENATERQSIINNEGYNPNGGDGGGNTDLLKEYEDIQKEYNANLRTLNEKKNNQLITDEEYNNELEELTLKTAESILALNDIDENTDAFAKGILDAAKSYISNAQKEDKVQDALDEYYASVQKLNNQYSNGVITQEELDAELYNLLEEVVKTTSAMGQISEIVQKLVDEYKKQKKNIANKQSSETGTPEIGQRDATFDYKKTESEILEEQAAVYKEYESNLKDTIEKLKGLEPTDEITDRLEKLSIELGKATANAESFEQAWKLSVIGEDIKDLKKEIAVGFIDNFKNIADAAERLTNAVENCIETMEDPDASAWERILSIFNAITQVTDTILQSVQLITQLKDAMDKLKAAEQAYQAVQDANAAKDMANAAASVAASQAEATGKGTAEAAKMPFPYNLLAIAAVVGTIAAVFASLPKFAGGGIVQGNSTMGDHNLARVNAGEMILNKQQQATLFGMLNGSNSGAMGKSSKVEFKIRGSELVGVLNNYGKKISK